MRWRCSPGTLPLTPVRPGVNSEIDQRKTGTHSIGEPDECCSLTRGPAGTENLMTQLETMLEVRRAVDLPDIGRIL